MFPGGEKIFPARNKIFLKRNKIFPIGEKIFPTGEKASLKPHNEFPLGITQFSPKPQKSFLIIYRKISAAR